MTSHNKTVMHPWHSVELFSKENDSICCYIEITPFDTVKFELDKASGLLKVDRPQKFSNICPCLYGLLPQTYCGDKVGKFCSDKLNRPNISGDGDPVDVCVLTEKNITQGNILLYARPIGGLRIIDNNEADDKIIAVLEGDAIYGKMTDISECPDSILDSIKHYFLTYKETPSDLEKQNKMKMEIAAVYSREEAMELIKHSMEDYKTLVNT